MALFEMSAVENPEHSTQRDQQSNHRDTRLEVPTLDTSTLLTAIKPSEDGYYQT